MLDGAPILVDHSPRGGGRALIAPVRHAIVVGIGAADRNALEDDRRSFIFYDLGEVTLGTAACGRAGTGPFLDPVVRIGHGGAGAAFTLADELRRTAYRTTPARHGRGDPVDRVVGDGAGYVLVDTQGKGCSRAGEVSDRTVVVRAGDGDRAQHLSRRDILGHRVVARLELTEDCPVGELPFSVQIVLAGIQREADGRGELIAVQGEVVVVGRREGRLLDDGDGADLSLLEGADVVGRAGWACIAALVADQVGVAGVDGRAAGQQGVGPGRAAVVA